MYPAEDASVTFPEDKLFSREGEKKILVVPLPRLLPLPSLLLSMATLRWLGSKLTFRLLLRGVDFCLPLMLALCRCFDLLLCFVSPGVEFVFEFGPMLVLV